jgi:predicted GNAT family acetyltransferase
MLTVPNQNSRWQSTAASEVCRLDNNHRAEVLQFLGRRPLHTFIMSSWIRDNGLDSSFNRGSFFGSRDQKGILDGVALIGHITLFETESNRVLGNFARLTRECQQAHTVLGRAERVDRFLEFYARGPVKPRMVCYELLFQKKTVASIDSQVSLRQAVAEDLELIVPTHALTAFEESGVNPLATDPKKFHERCARRVEQGRVWVVIEDGKLKFKADIVSETPDVVYLEGVYVSTDHRGNGYGSQCLSQLTNHLLDRTKSVCLLVNQANAAAQACYKKAGFEFREYYDTLYLQQTEDDHGGEK